MTDKVKLSSKVYDSALNTAVYITQYFDADSRDMMLNSLRSQMERYAEIEDKFKHLKGITSEFVHESEEIEQRAQIAENDENEGENTTAADTENLYKRYGEQVGKIQGDAANNNIFQQFIHQVEQLVASLSGGQDNSDDNEDDLVMTSTVNVICPISKKRMIEPMRNQICGHIYDKASVYEMIKTNLRTRCPLMGCSNTEYLRMDHLNPDIVTRVYLERTS